MPAAPEKVVLHPLVLLSVVDHYNRVAKDTKKRVVGVLLGETYKGTVDVTNSFAGAGRRGAGSRSRGAGARPLSDPGAPQCPSRRMTRTPASGSSTTATWRTCSRCSRR
jgi:hypothetical protein